MKNHIRRHPYIIIAFSLVIISLLTLAVFLIANSFSEREIEDVQLLLNTVVSIKIYASNDKELLQEAFEKIALFESELSRYDSESAVSQINEAAGKSPVFVPHDTREVVSTALEYAKRSSGRFDPTVGPLVEIWGIGGDNPRVPPEEEIAAVLPLIDYNSLQLNTETSEVFLQNPGMILDLGGIAKGWIADSVIDYLLQEGAQHILINLGGNVRASGGKPGDTPFRIGIQDPFESRGNYLGIFTIKKGSIVSSGVYERYFDADGIRYHHILDTKSGYPVSNNLVAVTVFSEYSVDGDALSTSLFTMGLKEGMELVSTLQNVEAVFVTRQKKIFLSSGASAMFELTQEEYSLEDYSFLPE